MNLQAHERDREYRRFGSSNDVADLTAYLTNYRDWVDTEWEAER